MFNVGGGEILAILVIALIILGPDKLPNAARQAGKYLNEFRRISSGFQDEVRGAMDLATTTDPTPVKMDPVEPAEPGIVAETVAMADGETATTSWSPDDADDPGIVAETVAMADGETATTSWSPDDADDPGIVAESAAMTAGEPPAQPGEQSGEQSGEPSTHPDPAPAADLPPMGTAVPPAKVGPSTDVAEAELAVTQAKLAAAQAELAEAEARLEAARAVAGTDPSTGTELDRGDDAGSVPPDSARA